MPSVTVTKYVVAKPEVTVVLLVVGVLRLKKLTPPLAVNAVLSPLHNSLSPLMAAFGNG